MLVLTRRVGQRLKIGEEIMVTILGTKGNQIRVGVDAPKDIVIVREEVYLRQSDEKQAHILENLLQNSVCSKAARRLSLRKLITEKGNEGQ